MFPDRTGWQWVPGTIRIVSYESCHLGVLNEDCHFALSDKKIIVKVQKMQIEALCLLQIRRIKFSLSAECAMARQLSRHIR